MNQHLPSEYQLQNTVTIVSPVNQHSYGKCPTCSWFTSMLVYQYDISIQFRASENLAKPATIPMDSNHKKVTTADPNWESRLKNHSQPLKNHSQWIQTYLNLIHHHVPEDLRLLFSRVCCAAPRLPLHSGVLGIVRASPVSRAIRSWPYGSTDDWLNWCSNKPQNMEAFMGTFMGISSINGGRCQILSGDLRFANWKITMFKNGKIIINVLMIYKCAVFHSYVK